MHIHIHVYTCASTYVQIHIYIYTYILLYMHACQNTLCVCASLLSCANSSSVQFTVYHANSKLKAAGGSCCKQVARRRLPQHCHFYWSMKLQMHPVKCIQWAQARVEMSCFWRQSKSGCKLSKNANQNQAMHSQARHPCWPQIHESDEIRGGPLQSSLYKGGSSCHGLGQKHAAPEGP